MKLFGYVRVSRTMGRGGDSFLSPHDQAKRIRSWADTHGHTVLAIFEDLDESGGKMTRPQFDLMIKSAEQVDAIVVAKLDRFGRTLVGALEAIQNLNARGVEFASVAEGVDPSTAAGRMMLNLLLVLAQFERERITESWDSTVAAIVAQGKFPASTPFGYAKVAKRLVPNDTEAPYLRGIFKRRANGDTWQSIADWLNANGARPRRAEQWTRSTVRDICRHELYLGVVAKQGYRNETAHEPLVTRAQWERAQNVHNLKPTATRGDGYPLAGLLRCAGCSFTMAGSTYKRRGAGAIRQYVCKRRHGTGTCTAAASITASVIEPFAEQLFLEHIGVLQLSPSVDAPQLRAAETELEDAIAEEVAWAEQFSAGFSPEAYAAGTRKRVERVTAARIAVDAARRAAVGVDLPTEAELRSMWPDLSVSAKRVLMAAGVDFFAVRRGRGPVAERVRLVGRGEGPLGLPRKGFSAPVRAL